MGLYEEGSVLKHFVPGSHVRIDEEYTDQNHHHMLERGVMKAGIGPENRPGYSVKN